MAAPLLILDGCWPDEPGRDTAISQIILDRVSTGTMAATARIYVPGREVAFGKQDTVTSQYPAAVAAATDAGFASVQRLAGGRAAVFTEDTIAFSIALPDPDPRSSIYERFDFITKVVVATLANLGIDAAVGEVPGEYCPGEYSVHHANGIKLMGVGQRLAKNAAHIGGVITVNGTDVLRRVLVPVYAALELQWNPATVGTLGDIQSGITNADVTRSFTASLANDFDITRADVPADLLVAADEIRNRYLPDW